ncbi:hypothetical protein ARALYDRAFT_908355 [Arabidopsis lyrata subsp. lyrata]|uniref:Uncharacterized protein n=1 Tax=Arabidopsis lyrata subsp. lyrata TaxID=81972 RepID=D7LXL6_ARALL|nr:hypothetical protein ARALYDRAFT_908355 [Arabidopsis lyrata subsp. lyrata]
MSLKELSNEATVSSASEINNNDDEAVASQGARNQETEEDSSEDMSLKELSNEDTVSSASEINNNDDEAVASQDDVNEETEEVWPEKMTVEILVSKTESIQGKLFRKKSQVKQHEELDWERKCLMKDTSVGNRRKLDQLVRRFALAPHLSDQQELQKCLVRQHEIEKVMGDEFKNLPEDASHESEEKKTDMKEGYFKVMEKSQNALLDKFSEIKEHQQLIAANRRSILNLFPKYKSLVDEIKGRLANQGIEEEILPVKPRIEAVLLEFKKLEDQLNIPCFEASHLDQMLKEILHATDPVLEPEDEVKHMIANSARLQARNNDAFSKFEHFSKAISGGEADAVRNFLSNGQFLITERISATETLIHRACSCGHEEIVKAMLDRMDDTDKVKLDWKLLYMVIANGNLEITKALLEKKPAYSETPMNKDGMLPCWFKLEG